jgi:uncharacterized membrane protein YphA (DoxX/SURF4 family)
MITHAPIATPDVAGLAPLEVESKKKTLLVPVGGESVLWSVFARWACFYSLAHLVTLIPVISGLYSSVTGAGMPLFARYVTIFNRFDAQYGQLNPPLYFLYQICIALIPALIWLAIDRKRKHEELTHEIARVVTRYALIVIFASYGFEKIVGGQGLWAYEPKYIASPYGDLWAGPTLMTWLGYSTVYEHFAAWVELSACLLLAFRRTTTIGALLYLAALLNVWVVNTGYTDLITMMTPLYFMPMPLFLLAPQMRRLAQYFLGGGRSDPSVVGWLTPATWWYWGGIVLKALVIPWILWTYIDGHIDLARDYYRRTPLAGVYRVDRFERNGVEEPLAYESPTRWRDVAIGRVAEDITVYTVDDTRITYVTAPGGIAQWRGEIAASQVKLTSGNQGDLDVTGRLEHSRGFASGRIERQNFGRLHFTRTGNIVTLDGIIDGAVVRAQLRRMDTKNMPFFKTRWYENDWRKIFWKGEP